MGYKNNLLRSALFGCIALSLATPALANPALSSFIITEATAVDPDTNTIDIQGRIDANQNFSSLDINGYPVSLLDATNFSASLPASENYQVRLYGDMGEYQVIDYAATDQPVDSAVQLVIGNQLTTDLGPVLGRLLTDLDLNAVLGFDANKCVVDTPFLRGCDLYIKQLAMVGTPDVSLSFTPENNGELTINIAIDIPEVVMQTKVKRGFWWGYRNTTINTKDVDVSFQIGVRPTNNQSIKLVLDEASDVNLSIGQMRVRSNALAPYLIPVFKDTIAAVIDHHLANIAGPFLALLPIPAIPINLPIDIDGDDINDAEFAINFNAETLDVLANNDGLAVLNGSIQSTMIAPGRNVLGTRRIDSTLPEAAPVTSPTDLGANIAVDLVNQVLTAVYQSGIEEKLNLSLPMSSLGDFGVILVFSFGYSFDDIVDVRLSFGTAPELLANSDSQYALGVDASLNDMRLILSTARPDGDEVILDITADALIDTSLGAETDGTLLLEFDNLLALNNTAVNAGTLVEDFGFPPDVLAQLVGAALPGLVTRLEPTINDLLNVARLELDIGEVLGGFLNAEFPSVPVAAFVTETGVSDDDSYLNVGVGIDFPQ